MPLSTCKSHRFTWRCTDSCKYRAIIAFPIEFIEVRHWNAVVGSTPFMAIVVGVGFGAGVIIWGQLYYRKCLIANDNKLVPEARLMPMMIGSTFFAAGLFIMGWTAKLSIHWIAYVSVPPAR